MKLRSLMITDVAIIGPDATVADAARVMGERSIGALVVVDKGAPVGIVTERDFLFKISASGRDPGQTRVRDIMTSPVVTLGPEEEMEAAIRLMGEKNLRRLPIVEGGRLVGIITATDVLLNLKKELMEIAAGAAAVLRAAPARPPLGQMVGVMAMFGLGVALDTVGGSRLALGEPGAVVMLMVGTVFLGGAALLLLRLLGAEEMKG